jgi:hypothetical protein
MSYTAKFNNILITNHTLVSEDADLGKKVLFIFVQTWYIFGQQVLL